MIETKSLFLVIENDTILSSILHTIGDFELRGVGGGVVLLALPAILPSVISSFFTQSKGGGRARGSLDPPLAMNASETRVDLALIQTSAFLI